MATALNSLCPNVENSGFQTVLRRRSLGGAWRNLGIAFFSAIKILETSIALLKLFEMYWNAEKTPHALN